jgi:hypothetical protein
MELTLSTEAAEKLVGNVKKWQEEVDPGDDDSFAEGLDILLAITYMFDDILVQAGEREPLTKMEEKARTANSYYLPMSILPNAGRNP